MGGRCVIICADCGADERSSMGGAVTGTGDCSGSAVTGAHDGSRRAVSGADDSSSSSSSTDGIVGYGTGGGVNCGRGDDDVGTQSGGTRSQ